MYGKKYRKKQEERNETVREFQFSFVEKIYHFGFLNYIFVNFVHCSILGE